MERSANTFQSARIYSARDLGQRSNTGPESAEDQIAEICSVLDDSQSLQLRRFIDDELVTILEGQEFTCTTILDAGDTLLGSLKCIEENPGPNKGDVSALREGVKDFLESN